MDLLQNVLLNFFFLFIAFFILGTCRLFDMGFSAPQIDDEKKTFADFLNDDIEAFKKYVNNIAQAEIFKPSRKSILYELEKLEKEINEKKSD